MQHCQQPKCCGALCVSFECAFIKAHLVGVQVFNTPEPNGAGSDSGQEAADQILSEMASTSGQLVVQTGVVEGSSLAAAKSVHDW